MNKSQSKYFNTAARMSDALISLLEAKPLAYITVKEICDRAQVNRSTFYLHYENIGDLLEETTRRLVDTFQSRFPVNSVDITARFGSGELSDLNFVSEQYLHPYLSYMRDNRTVFLTVLDHINLFGFDQIYQRLFQYIFNPILDRFHYPEQDRKYVMLFYMNGLHAVAVEWLKDGCTKSIEEVTEIIQVCVFGRAQTFASALQSLGMQKE